MQQARSLARLTYTALVGLVVLAVLGIVTLVVVPSLVGLQGVIVLSGSMEPALRTGGLAFVEPLEDEIVHDGEGITISRPAVREIEVGQIITFRAASNGRNRISHRVIGVFDDQEGLRFVTQGDSSPLPDARAVPAAAVVGTVEAHVQYLGYVADRVRHRETFYMIVGLPALLIVVGELGNIAKEVRRLRAARATRSAVSG